MEGEQFSLCWNNFHMNLSSGFHSLLQDEALVDVTLAAEGRYLKAHKTVLSVCSPYFKELFKVNPCEHPIVILQDVNYEALNSLLQFMYQGEVSVSQEEIPTFMRVAETLKIKGLTENSSSELNGVLNNSSMHGESPQSYGKQVIKKAKPIKRVLKPIQHLNPLDSSLCVKLPQAVHSPPSVSSPQPSPKKPCLEEASVPTPEFVEPPINPKQEPIDNNDDDDELREQSYDEHSMDMAAMLDTTLGEPSHPSATWTPDPSKMSADTSSPGTLQCILGKRGNPRLIMDGHTFYKKSTYKGKSFWYCKHSRTSQKCPAVCWTQNGHIVKWPSSHNHFVIPDVFNPDEDMEVPIEQIQEVLIHTALCG